MQATRGACCCGSRSTSSSVSSRPFPGSRVPASPSAAPRGRRATVVMAKAKDVEQVQLVDPLGMTSPPQGGPSLSAVPIALVAAASFGLAWVFKSQQGQGKKKQQLEPWPEIPRPDADPRAYQMALARTRQALDVQKAVAYMKAGEPARALVELHRALEENAVCRSPLLDGHQTRAELRDLYKLHLLNTPVPHSFATLLQLRELLGITPQEGEDIEVNVLQTGTAFSI